MQSNCSEIIGAGDDIVGKRNTVQCTLLKPNVVKHENGPSQKTGEHIFLKLTYQTELHFHGIIGKRLLLRYIEPIPWTCKDVRKSIGAM